MGFPKVGYINGWIGWFMMENPKKTWMIEQSHFRLFESDMTNLKLDLVFAQTSSDMIFIFIHFPALFLTSYDKTHRFGF